MSGLPIIPSIGDKLKKNEKEVIYTVLECKGCKEEKIREFLDGDIVFKEITGEKCTKCNLNYVIKQIYVEIIKKK